MSVCWDPSRVEEYVPEADRDKPPTEQRVFLLGYLKAKHLAEVQDLVASITMSADGETQTQFRATSSFQYEMLVRSLKGWRNVPGPNGTQLVFKEDGKGYVNGDLVDWIPPSVRLELSVKATEMNMLGEEDRKNSGSRPG